MLHLTLLVSWLSAEGGGEQERSFLLSLSPADNSKCLLTPVTNNNNDKHLKLTSQAQPVPEHSYLLQQNNLNSTYNQQPLHHHQHHQQHQPAHNNQHNGKHWNTMVSQTVQVIYLSVELLFPREENVLSISRVIRLTIYIHNYPLMTPLPPLPSPPPSCIFSASSSLIQ